MSRVRAPSISPQIRRPPQQYQPAQGVSLEQHLSDIAEAVNRKADIAGIPNFGAIQLTSEAGLPYLIYVDAAGHLQCVPATL